MSLYIIFFLVIVFTACLEHILKGFKNIRQIILLLDLLLLVSALTFRYLQGTDYVTYRLIYGNMIDQYASWTEFVTYRKGKRENLFYFLFWLFAKIGLPYQAVLGFIALVQTVLIWRFLNKYCGDYKCLALGVLYYGYTLIYQFSALREGLVIAIFLGSMLPFFESRKWGWYYAFALICICVHNTALLYFFLPLLKAVKEKMAELMTACALLVGILFWGAHIQDKLIQKVPEAIGIYLGKQFSILSLLMHIVIGAGIIFCYHRIGANEFYENIYKIYLFGLSIYFLLVSNSFSATRLFDVCRFVDIILFVVFVQRYERTRFLKWIYTGTMIFAFGMTLKSIDASINMGYKDSVNVWNYPYISIFDKEKYDEYTIDVSELEI